jgi:activator of HSP90 ATPase
MKLKTTTITQRVVIPALPDEVYEAFTNAKKHSEVTGGKATGNPTIGSKFTAWDGYILGKNLELEKDKKIVQEWVTSDWPQGYPPSKLELTFREVGGKTELTMVHSDVPAEREDELKQGWIDFYWEPLKAHFRKESTHPESHV